MLDFEFGEHIGQGGMADVYLGFQRGMEGFEKLVVLKQILPSYAKSSVFRSMFVNEAKLAAAIRHPNVVETYHIHQSDERLFIAMEYIDGLTLLEVLRSLGKEHIPIIIAARIVADLAAGVNAAHNLTKPDGSITPIVHLDITPSNLMVSQNGIAKILDYGIAKAATGSDKESDFSGGKPGYIPPEYTSKGIIDPRGDVFQLGLVLHELLTGKLLFDADSPTAAIVASETSPIVAPSAWRPEIPKALDDIVLSCLERDLEKRTASAKLLRTQLSTFLKSRGNPSSAEVAYWLQANCYGNLKTKKSLETRVRRESEMKRVARGTGSAPIGDITSVRHDNPTRSLRSKSEIQELLQTPHKVQIKPTATPRREQKNKTQNTLVKSPKVFLWLLMAVMLSFSSYGAYYSLFKSPQQNQTAPPSQAIQAAPPKTEPSKQAMAPKPAVVLEKPATQPVANPELPSEETVAEAQAPVPVKKSKRRKSKNRTPTRSAQAAREPKDTSVKEKIPKTDLHDPWNSGSE